MNDYFTKKDAEEFLEDIKQFENNIIEDNRRKFDERILALFPDRDRARVLQKLEKKIDF